jgi:trypsin-like peptidase
MSNDFQKSIVRVHKADTQNISGAGVLVSPRHVLTCAHVVANALSTNKNVNLTGRELIIDFPYIDAKVTYRARVVRWPEVPPEDGRDLAGLEFVDALPANAVSARLRVLNLMKNFDIKIGGFPRQFDKGQWLTAEARGPSGDTVQFNITDLFEYSIEHGYSGTAVWHIDSGDVAGIVVKVDEGHEKKAGYFIPAENIRQFWGEVVDPISWEYLTYDYACYISYCPVWDAEQQQGIIKFVEDFGRHLTSKLSIYTPEVQKVYYDDTRLRVNQGFFNAEMAAKLCRSASMIVIGIPAYFYPHMDCAREMRMMLNFQQYRQERIADSPIKQLIIPVIFGGKRWLPSSFTNMEPCYSFEKIQLRDAMDSPEAQQVIMDIAEHIFECCDQISQYNNLFPCDNIALPSNEELNEWREKYARQTPNRLPMRGTFG